MNITSDSQVMLLLCSHLALPSDPDVAPLTLREWNPLARKIRSISLRPGSLLDLTEQEISDNLNIPGEESFRISELLERRAALAFELERLESLGISVMTRSDKEYPLRYRQRLKDSAPPVLFFAGNKELLGQPGIAVVGSRNLDSVGQECAEFVGNACAWSGLILYSGGARGVDAISMNSALEGRGTVVGILANSLEKAVRDADARQALIRGDLCLVTPYSPGAGFTVGAAMGRNKLIYSLADYAIVVASEAAKGGTWAGSNEALKAGWVPVFILYHVDMLEGNRLLIEKGGIPIPYPFEMDFMKLADWLEEQVIPVKPKYSQPGLGFELESNS